MSDMFEMLERLGSDEVSIRSRENIIKAPFGYPGGKSRSVKEILPKLPNTGKYIEVFGGSGIVLLNKQPSKFEVFNDRFSGVVDFYKCLRDKDMMERLKEILSLYLYSREDFLECRDTWQDTKDTVERAAKWYYMHQHSFTNQGRNFARALKGSTSQKINSHFPLFSIIHKRIQNVLFENLDWRICLKDFDDHNAVFYLDPPYMPETIISNVKSYYTHTMTKEDHIELCNTIFKMKGFVALSGYKNELYETYPWDDVHVWEVFVSFCGMSFQEGNNFAKYKDHLQRSNIKEYLYIKHNE